MPVQFFGQYLLTHKIVDRQQLLDAIAHQDSHNLRLGDHAVVRGLLTQADAERINHAQQERDLRFGEVAIQLELLTADQVEELVTFQRNNHVYLGDALVARGHCERSTVDEALARFKEEQKDYEVEGFDVQSFGVPEPEAYSCAFDMTHKFLLRMWGVHNKPGAITRAAAPLQLAKHRVRLRFKGAWDSDYIVSADPDVLRVAAKAILNDDAADDDVCHDLLREFANIVCGNVAAMLARRGRPTNISPPDDVPAQFALSDREALVATLVSPHGEILVALTF